MTMRKTTAWIMLIILILSISQTTAESATGIRDLFQAPEITATPAPNAFRFRNGIRWGMSREQVKALETEPMNERIMQAWAVMLTEGKVSVSRFAADLVFMFHEDKLMMITYEFPSALPDDYLYLSGALSSVYGEKTETDPMKIKALMDAIYPNYYQTEKLTQAYGWNSSDGTVVYLYYYSDEAFAIMYVSPETGSSIYQTNGL